MKIKGAFMNFLNILKYKLLIHIRLQYGVTAKKIEKYLPIKISSSILYIFAFILQIQSSVILCFFIQSLTNNSIILKSIFVILGTFFILNCSTMGRKAFKKTSLIEDENILLYSKYSDSQIFSLIVVEEFFKVLIQDIFIFIPNIFLIHYFSTGFIDYIFKSILFLIVSFLTFIISNTALNRKMNKNLYNNKIKLYCKEIFYFTKYVMIICLSYNIGKIIFAPILSKKIDINNIFSDILDINVSIKNNVTIYMNKFEEFKKYILNSILNLDFKFSITSEFVLIILSLIILCLVLVFNNVRYRKNMHLPNSIDNYRAIILNRYLDLLIIINKFLFKDNFIINKDIQILRQKLNLITNYEFLSFIIPLVSTVNFGLVLFLAKNNNCIISANILLSIFIIMFLFDITSIMKSRLPIIILINSELRNILLIRNSSYSIKELVKNKINLLRLFMIIPSIITILQVIYLLTIIKCNTTLILTIIIIGITLFLIASRLQIYGDIFFDRFNYKNYEEFYENIREQKLYNKFFSIPKRIISMPIIIMFIISLTLNLSEKAFTFIIIYTLITSIIAYIISMKLLNKGVNNFYEKIIEV